VVVVDVGAAGRAGCNGVMFVCLFGGGGGGGALALGYGTSVRRWRRRKGEEE